MIKNFHCEKNLAQYTDSMLFDSGEVIASIDYVDDKTGKGIEMDLKVCGHVKVFFNDEPFRYSSEFPEKLTKLIKSNPEWELDERVCVCENNWFEFIYQFKDCQWSDGIVMEEDISKMSVEEIKSLMVTLCSMLLREDTK